MSRLASAGSYYGDAQPDEVPGDSAGAIAGWSHQAAEPETQAGRLRRQLSTCRSATKMRRFRMSSRNSTWETTSLHLVVAIAMMHSVLLSCNSGSAPELALEGREPESSKRSSAIVDVSELAITLHSYDGESVLYNKETLSRSLVAQWCENAEKEWVTCERGALVAGSVASYKAMQMANLSSAYPNKTREDLERWLVKQSMPKARASELSEKAVNSLGSSWGKRMTRGIWILSTASLVLDLYDASNAKSQTSATQERSSFGD